MPSNMPPGYSDEGGDIATCGEDTAMYQDLLTIFDRYRKWLIANDKDFFNDNDKRAAMKICNEIEALLCSMEGPF